MAEPGLWDQKGLLNLPSAAQGETEHSECLALPTSQPNTHQKKKDDGHNHTNDEILAFEEFHDAKRFGVIIVQLA